MSVFIALTQTLHRNVGINLRGAQAGMAQQFLNRTQISTAIQKVGGRRVTQRVRAGYARWGIPQ